VESLKSKLLGDVRAMFGPWDVAKTADWHIERWRNYVIGCIEHRFAEQSPESEIRADERAKCVAQVRDFSNRYVEKWESAGVDSKAEGWAILMASFDLHEREWIESPSQVGSDDSRMKAGPAEVVPNAGSRPAGAQS
jgi:hypothetical protein